MKRIRRRHTAGAQGEDAELVDSLLRRGWGTVQLMRHRHMYRCVHINLFRSYSGRSSLGQEGAVLRFLNQITREFSMHG